jgi:hypothetical protein
LIKTSLWSPIRGFGRRLGRTLLATLDALSFSTIKVGTTSDPKLQIECSLVMIQLKAGYILLYTGKDLLMSCY